MPNGSGYCPYDDEGTRARDTYLVKNGVLTGRLHSAATAAALDEAVTGNARAISFEFEPIVRMTSTWIAGGTDTFESLLRGAEGGLYIPDFFHGSGMSTFTIAPARAYRIRGGKPAEPGAGQRDLRQCDADAASDRRRDGPRRSCAACSRAAAAKWSSGRCALRSAGRTCGCAA